MTHPTEVCFKIGKLEQSTTDQEVQRYLRTGEPDGYYRVWTGNDFLSRATNGRDALLHALITAVREGEIGRRLPELPPGFEPASFASAKVTPMVTGLFPARSETPFSICWRVSRIRDSPEHRRGASDRKLPALGLGRGRPLPGQHRREVPERRPPVLGWNESGDHLLRLDGLF